ncbi:MAG: hypothetical protein ABI629_08730 [bacterium]
MIPRTFVGIVAAALLLGGCVKPVPPPPATVRTVAVFPAVNQTGDELLIAGGSLLEKYVFDTERFTVPDVLAATARTLLDERGYRIVSPEAVAAALAGRRPASAYQAAAMAKEKGLPGMVLFIDLRRWVVASPTSIIVSLRVDLIDPASGQIVWDVDREARPVSTQGTIDIANAYNVAARSVMAEVLASFVPTGAGAAP